MLSLFRPAAHIDRLPADKVDPFYKRMRWQVFFGIFFGYAGYYLVRKNFSLAMPYLIEQGFSVVISVSRSPGSPSLTVCPSS